MQKGLPTVWVGGENRIVWAWVVRNGDLMGWVSPTMAELMESLSLEALTEVDTVKKITLASYGRSDSPRCHSRHGGGSVSLRVGP